MFRNYFKTALRNLWKSKGFSAINIIGLAIGLATCLLIILYVFDELGYDKYNKKASRIYRINNDIKFGGNNFNLTQVPGVCGPALVRELPSVEQYARFRYHGSFLVKKGNTNLREQNVVYADSTMFDVFTLPMISGDPKSALTVPHSLVITETTAKKYFNRTDVAGQTMVINDTINYKIAGVIEDIPRQSHFNFDFFVPMLQDEYSRDESGWLS
ncbi:MAG: cell division protein FtsX, partial [Bacteroidetes bacterium]